jgi:hypothetical protein
MAQFKAFASNVEIAGEALLSFVAALSWNEVFVLEILGRHGISNVQPKQWYPQQAVLDFLREIAETMGEHTLYQLGTKVPEHAIYPPEIDSLEKGLSSLDVVYHLNHRGGEIGHYQLVRLESNQAVTVCHNPYPCDLDRGIITTTVRHFAASGAAVSVQHEPNGGCRKLGGESCTYIVEWILFRQRKNQA